MFHVSMYYLRAAGAAASKGEKYLFILAKAQLDGQDRRQQMWNTIAMCGHRFCSPQLDIQSCSPSAPAGGSHQLLA